MSQERYVGILVGLITAIVTLILLALLEPREANSKGELQPLPTCLDSATRDTIQRLTDRAVDQGYQRHVTHLFDVLMGNPNTEQFNRARNGMQNGIKGYLLAQEHVNAWTPSVCP